MLASKVRCSFRSPDVIEHLRRRGERVALRPADTPRGPASGNSPRVAEQCRQIASGSAYPQPGVRFTCLNFHQRADAPVAPNTCWTTFQFPAPPRGRGAAPSYGVLALRRTFPAAFSIVWKLRSSASLTGLVSLPGLHWARRISGVVGLRRSITVKQTHRPSLGTEPCLACTCSVARSVLEESCSAEPLRAPPAPPGQSCAANVRFFPSRGTVDLSRPRIRPPHFDFVRTLRLFLRAPADYAHPTLLSSAMSVSWQSREYQSSNIDTSWSKFLAVLISAGSLVKVRFHPLGQLRKMLPFLPRELPTQGVFRDPELLGQKNLAVKECPT